MTALLLGVKEGDEVILPSFTFVSTANAFVLRGARPVFADVHPETLNLDETQLERLITPRTRAIIPVHYAGVACAMDGILAVAEKHGIAVAEDNAHGLFGRFRGKALGTFGSLATLSFHETKNIVCGEGGALLINDRKLAERAEIIREKGTDRSKFFRGLIDKYTWVDLGSSYLPSEFLAAFLFGQLEQRRRIQAARHRLWNAYYDALTPWAGKHGFRLPAVPEGCDHPAHIFFLLAPSLAARQGLMQHLKSKGIGSAFHYLPLHLSAMGVRYGGKPGDCPVTERAADCLLRLPMYYSLSDEDQARVLTAVTEFQP
jgi:dTDP-4-amino-4,6-dideoxygalactose transaminase